MCCACALSLQMYFLNPDGADKTLSLHRASHDMRDSNFRSSGASLRPESQEPGGTGGYRVYHSGNADRTDLSTSARRNVQAWVLCVINNTGQSLLSTSTLPSTLTSLCITRQPGQVLPNRPTLPHAPHPNTHLEHHQTYYATNQPTSQRCFERTHTTSLPIIITSTPTSKSNYSFTTRETPT
jgi:hypothetical protein